MKFAIALSIFFNPLIAFAQAGKIQPASATALSISVWIAIAGIVASVLFGGCAGAIISIMYNKKKSKTIYRSLLTAYCLEFFYAFERCMVYYKQLHLKNEISYSALFEFSDIAFLSRFTEVCSDMQLVKTIVSLKSVYFQIARHVEKVSYYIIESKGLETVDDINYRKTGIQAEIHRGAAIGFFNSSYDKIISDTLYVLEAGKKISKDMSNLCEAFEKTKKEKNDIDIEMAKKDQPQPS
jgi:hypothetical protein